MHVKWMQDVCKSKQTHKTYLQQYPTAEDFLPQPAFSKESSFIFFTLPNKLSYAGGGGKSSKISGCLDKCSWLKLKPTFQLTAK